MWEGFWKVPGGGETKHQDRGDHVWASVGREEGLMSCAGQGLHPLCQPQSGHSQAEELSLDGEASVKAGADMSG